MNNLGRGPLDIHKILGPREEAGPFLAPGL